MCTVANTLLAHVAIEIDSSSARRGAPGVSSGT
jgi:hypothetical protein